MRRWMRNEPRGVRAIAHFPLLQYFFPEPVETGIERYNWPPLYMYIRCLAILTTTDVAPLAFGLPAADARSGLDAVFFLMVVGVGATTAGTSTGAAVVTVTSCAGTALVGTTCVDGTDVGAAVVGAAVVGAAVVGAAVVGAAVEGGAGATVVGANVGVGSKGTSWALTPEAAKPSTTMPPRNTVETLVIRRVNELGKVCTPIDYRPTMHRRQCLKPQSFVFSS
jgi:hypothetical protein